MRTACEAASSEDVNDDVCDDYYFLRCVQEFPTRKLAFSTVVVIVVVESPAAAKRVGWNAVVVLGECGDGPHLDTNTYT